MGWMQLVNDECTSTRILIRALCFLRNLASFALGCFPPVVIAVVARRLKSNET